MASSRSHIHSTFLTVLLGIFSGTVIQAQDVFLDAPMTIIPHAGTYHAGPPMPPFDPGFVPVPQPTPAVPLLGFMGTDLHWGVRVDSVGYGSAARRIGLEPGDVIIALNGMPVRCMHDYHRALAQSGGVVELEVRDVRTGNHVTTIPYCLFQPVPAGVAGAMAHPVH